MEPTTNSVSLLVTGGAGFIGSALIRQIIDESDASVVNVDALTYAADLESLGAAARDPRHVFEHADIRDRAALARVFDRRRPDAVIHLAAQTHVDRSIGAPRPFLETNVDGTCNLLEAAADYWSRLPATSRERFRFLHVSTDEVFGDLAPDAPAFVETSPYAPSSPYAASKASADHLARAWQRTYGLPVIVAHPSNNYGPCQFPEKLIPLVVLEAAAGRPIPVYGDGGNVRDWLHVDDTAAALRRLVAAGRPGRSYNVGGQTERTNLDVVGAICGILDEIAPRAAGPHAALIELVADRPGHDRRYALDNARIAGEIGWRPSVPFDAGLARTVRWYLDNPEWVARARARLGSGPRPAPRAERKAGA